MSGPLKPNGYVDIDALLERYVAAGINADILPGAHTRAARLFVNGGYSQGVRGADQHHTAQHINMREEDSIAYMTFWAPYPVMCNTYPWKDGRLTICAAGPTYTAGAGGPVGEVTSGNKQLWSREIGNNGIGEPYPKAQQDTIVVASAVEAEFFGQLWDDDTFWSWWRFPAHFEWAPGRKVDPRGPSRWSSNQNAQWDMNKFRNEVRAIHSVLYPTNPQPPITGDDDMQYLTKMDRMHDSRPGNHQLSELVQVTLKPGENRKVPLGMAHVHAVRVTVVNSRGHGYVSITGTPGLGNPIVNIWDGKQGDGTLTFATPDGHGYLATTVECDVIVDVTGRG